MYYCKNCGEPYSTDEAVLCVNCGVPRNSGSNYCHNCGNPVRPDEAVCLTCGVPTKPYNNAGANSNAKSKIAAGLLAIFLGQFGVHNFYLGYIGKAVTQLVLTIVGYVLCCILIGVLFIFATSIWGLVEGIMILCGKINVDANGVPLTD